jgi:hypothetical protein
VTGQSIVVDRGSVNNSLIIDSPKPGTDRRVNRL